MSLTCEQIAVQALARVAEVTDAGAPPRSLLYRRIGVRQQLLFAEAARTNPDYYGACAEANLTDGSADLADIAFPLATPELISRVTIIDRGTANYANGQTVNVVPLADVNAALAPRMTLRDLVLEQVGTELAGVAAVAVYYSRLSQTYAPTDSDTVVELASPFDELLVVDLTKDILRKLRQVDEATRDAEIKRLDGEESALESAFITHVRDYAPVQSRFGRAPSGVRG